MDVCHIDYEPRGTLVRLIIQHLHNSAKPKHRQLAEKWGASPLKEAGFALATKTQILPVVVARLNVDMGHLRRELAKRRMEVVQCATKGMALHLNDRELPYRLLSDVDSFLLEFDSAVDLTEKFLKKVLRALGVRPPKKTFETALRDQGQDAAWLQLLAKDRNLFIHEKAPWLALEVKSRHPLRCSLLVLKRNTKDAADPQDFVRLEDYHTIYNGFASSMVAAQKWLTAQVDQAK
jgi:hypothetical protein